MTIALGVMASDGIVVAADTQATYPPDWKMSRGKLWPGFRLGADDLHCSCLVTGAGTGLTIGSLAQRLHARFKADRSLYPDTLQPSFTEVLEDYYARHVIPFAAFPEPERAGADLLIAATHPRRVDTLLVSSGSEFVAQSFYAAIGIGGAFAQTLLDRFYHLPALNTWLVAYVMFQVKESVDGCGKKTDICCVRNGTFAVIPRPRTEALEAVMREHVFPLEPLVFRHLVGASPPGFGPHMKDHEPKVAEAKDAITKLLNDLTGDAKEKQTEQ